MKSKTYYSKSNPDIEYIEKKDNLKQITLDIYYAKNDRYHPHMVRTHSNYG